MLLYWSEDFIGVSQMELMKTNNALTMSSEEIANLVESRHDNVKITIERLVEKGIISFTATQEPPKNGGKNKTIYHVNKRDSYIIVAQLCPEFTARLVNRWQELENNHMLKPLSNRDLALMVIAECDRAEKAESKVKLLTHQNKLYSSTELAKELNFKSGQFLNKKLEELNVQYKLNGTWILYAAYSDLIYTSIKQTELENGKIIYDRKWTGLGREFILNLLGNK